MPHTFREIIDDSCLAIKKGNLGMDCGFLVMCFTFITCLVKSGKIFTRIFKEPTPPCRSCPSFQVSVFSFQGCRKQPRRDEGTPRRKLNLFSLPSQRPYCCFLFFLRFSLSLLSGLPCWGLQVFGVWLSQLGFAVWNAMILIIMKR